MAARYLPAHRGDHVGGDWYDAVAVDEHRLALVIGDVTGHNVAAAAAMSQLRSILRALLVDRQESPAAMLRRLEHISRTLGSGTLASVVLAYLDTSASGGHVLTWANAGHPPPLLRTAGGVTGMLDGADPLLGAVRHASRRNHTTTLAPGSMLLLYTDGLVETRHSTIDAGIDAVRGVLADPSLDDPQQLADVLLALPHGSEDDVAVLAVSTDQADAQAP
jgi:serine phosphatase RsbU (regulator of sigma subunit)